VKVLDYLIQKIVLLLMMMLWKVKLVILLKLFLLGFVSDDNTTFTDTVSPTPSDSGTVHYLVNGIDIGSATYKFSLPYTFPLSTNDESHTSKAV